MSSFGDSFNDGGLSGNVNITVDANPTLSGLTFDSSFSYTIREWQSITLGTGPFNLKANNRPGSSPSRFNRGFTILE